MQETQEIRVWSLGLEDTLEEETVTHSSTLPKKSHGQRSLVCYSPKGCKEFHTAQQLSIAQRNSITKNQAIQWKNVQKDPKRL